MAVWGSERLILRPWSHSDSDVDRIFDVYSRWEVVRYLGSVPTAIETREQAEAAVDWWAQRGSADGTLGVWAVEVATTGIVAGTVLLVGLPEPSDGTPGRGETEVGWHFHPDSWGHGYATEAAAAVLHRAFARGLRQIWALVRPENEPSLRVCHRLGMTPLGRTHRWYEVELESFRLDAPAQA